MKVISALKNLLLTLALLLVGALPSFAQSITLQGRVVNSSGTAITGSSVQFRVQILTPDSNLCVLYDESQTLDLSHSEGQFSINLNSGVGTVNAPTTYSLEQSVSNFQGFSIGAGYCQGTSSAVAYSPSFDSSRKVQITFKDPGTMSAFEAIPLISLSPNATTIDATRVGGYPASSLLRVVDGAIPGAPASFSTAQFTELQALIAGTSANYMSSSNGSTTGAKLPTVSGNPSAPSSGSIWFDTSSGTIKYYNGGSISTVGTSSANGTITGVTTSAPLSGSGTSGSVNISLANSGVTAGSYGGPASVPVLTVDAFGRVTAASTAAISGVAPGGTAGGDLSGSYPNPTVAKMQGKVISAVAPNAGQALKFDGTSWSGANLAMTDIYASDNTPVVSNGACSASQTLYIDSNGHFQCQGIGTLAAGAITSGTLAAAQMPAFTGDASSAAGSTAFTLATVGSAGTYKSVTVDAKGRVLAGTNPTTLSGFGITDSVQNTGGLPSMAAGADASKPAAGTAGRLYVASDTFKIYRDNGTGWDLIASATGSGGTITNVTAGMGLTGGGTSGTVTVSMPTVGSVGTYTKVVTDAEGRVASGGTLVASDIPALPWSQITSTPTTLSGYGITNGVANAGAAVSLQAGLASAMPTAGTAGRVYIATDANTISYDTGSAWTTITSGTGFTGSLSGDVTGGQSATVVSKVGAVTAANVASGANLANAATNLNTASTIVKRDSSGNFAAGAVSEGSSIFRDSAANSVTLAAPATVTTSYNLTLPAAAPTSSGQILSATTAGVLSWASPSSVFSTSVTAPITNSGSATAPNIGISQAATSTSGYLSSTDWNTFTAKLSSALTSAYLFIGNASNVATGVALSGDATLTNAGALTVTGIKGKAVSAAPTTTGQVLRYDGTNITPNFLSMADLRSTVTGSSALTTGCTASQTLTWNSGTDNLMCQSISVAAATQITGVLPIANGGTGAASTSQGYVFAGPTSGSGAPSFRLLASTDLPSGSITGTGTTGYVPYFSAASTLANSPIAVSGSSVGIGTTSPQDFLQVAGGIRATGTATGAVANSSALDYYSGSTRLLSWGPTTSTYSPIAFWQTTSNTSTPIERMRIDANGNVGIGTTAPANKLHIVVGSTDGVNIDATQNPLLVLSQNGVAKTQIANASAAGSFDAAAVGGDLVTRTFGGAMRFNTNNGNGTSAFTILGANGNVGIGTTSPAVALDVGGGTSSDIIGYPNLVARFNAGGVGGSVVVGSVNGNAAYVASTPSSANGLTFYTNGTTSSPVINLSNAGNVGIGTTASSQMLTVNGIAQATSFISTSDRRLKENITTIPGLALINKMRGVRFDWRKNQEKDFGLIAQEVEEVIPEAVVTDKISGYKSVKYPNLVGPIIEAIKELSSKLELINAGVAALNKHPKGSSKGEAERARTPASILNLDEELGQLRAENAAKDKRIKDLERRLDRIEKQLGEVGDKNGQK